jgi:cephalosporin hydroxylase
MALSGRRVLIAVAILSAGLNLFQYFRMTDRYTIDRFHTLFHDSATTWREARWFGVPTLQNPNDVWIHQEIITELKPDFIIEAGTAHGGSAVLWAMILEQVNPRGKVITIDVYDQVEVARLMNEPESGVERLHALRLWKERVEFVKGSSTDPSIVDRLRQRVKGHKVLVILDSDHHKDHVLAELNAYAPMINVGSYLIVQDTSINGHPVLKRYGPGPMEAVDEFLTANKQFEPDRSRERFLFTMHPKGYLKRIKPDLPT